MRMLPGEVRWSITEGDRPKGRDLEMIRERGVELRSFPPASKSVREAMIARLFMRWSKDSPNDPTRVECYAMDLADFPAWAISKGISDIIGGLVLKSPEFRPSSLEVRAAVEARFAPVRDEATSIDVLLEACERPVADAPPEIAAERRKQLAEMVRASMRAGAPPADPPRARDMRLASKFDDARAGNPGGSATRLSDEALATFGLRRQDEEDLRRMSEEAAE